jgi:hypothetical protein
VKEFVEVQAPVTMVGGYEFTVVVDGSHWVVVVVRSLSVHCEKSVLCALEVMWLGYDATEHDSTSCCRFIFSPKLEFRKVISFMPR